MLQVLITVMFELAGALCVRVFGGQTTAAAGPVHMWRLCVNVLSSEVVARLWFQRVKSAEEETLPAWSWSERRRRLALTEESKPLHLSDSRDVRSPVNVLT